MRAMHRCVMSKASRCVACTPTKSRASQGERVESLRMPYKHRKISRVHNSGISRQYKKLSMGSQAWNQLLWQGMIRRGRWVFGGAERMQTSLRKRQATVGPVPVATISTKRRTLVPALFLRRIH
jgi:hypothetical protein